MGNLKLGNKVDQTRGGNMAQVEHSEYVGYCEHGCG